MPRGPVGKVYEPTIKPDPSDFPSEGKWKGKGKHIDDEIQKQIDDEIQKQIQQQINDEIRDQMTFSTKAKDDASLAQKLNDHWNNWYKLKTSLRQRGGEGGGRPPRKARACG